MRVLSLLAIMSALLVSCEKRKASSACWSARQAARDAIGQRNLDRAEKLLEEARSTCAGQSTDDLARIEGVLEDRRRSELERQRSESEREKAIAHPTQQFVTWATASAKELPESLQAVECAERGSPNFGFCEAQRKGQPAMTVRYWERARTAVRYSFTTDLPLECEDLGDHRRVRRWSVGQKSYELCELTQREARNLSALVIRGEGDNQMHIFSFDYLKHDPEFERSLRVRQ